MEQIQQPAIPHLVQVYQPSVSNAKIQNPQIIHISHPSLPTPQGKVTYQQTITSQSIQIPVTSQVSEMHGQQLPMSQSQLVMSCQQGLQSLQTLQSQAQVLQSDMSQSLITSHVLLPQHMLVNGVPSYYSQYGFPKEQCIVTKLEPRLSVMEKENESETEKTSQTEPEVSLKKRSRSQIPDPTHWACNVRKQKHQRGEAYISRRGKYVPEKRIRNTKDCIKTCKFKCNEKISDAEREHIFKSFYALNPNDKKHFLLNTTERIYIKHKISDSHKRKYSFKYFFIVRSDRHTVCKNFYLGTLAISQKPVYNVHIGKTDLNMPKPDGRGHSKASSHSIPCDVKDGVRKHIMSFTTLDSKAVLQYSKKKQYLDSNLSVKQMYNMYFNECNKDSIVVPVKESMYRKIFRQEFNLHFRKTKSEPVLCSRCKCTIKKK